MVKVLFICHGNICRSPMAEFLFKDMVKKRNLSEQFYIASAATSNEEIGCPVHHETKYKLKQCGISTEGKKAIRLTKEDCMEYDYLIGMDKWNYDNIVKLCTDKSNIKKVYRLLDFTDNPRDVADPWYTGDFDKAFEDISNGCEAFLSWLCANGRV